MSQQGLGEVFLRVIGVIITIQFFSGVFISIGTPQSFSNFGPGNSLLHIAFSLLFSLPTILVGLFLVLFGGRLSKFLFRENKDISPSQSIDSVQMGHIGITMVGIWFLISSIPDFAIEGFYWFKEQVHTPDPGLYPEEYYGAKIPSYAKENLIYTSIFIGVSAVLILKAEAFANLLFNRTKKN